MPSSRSAIKPVQAGVWSFEFTRSEHGWHPHAHCIYLADRARLDVPALREEWRQITGDSHVFRVDPFNPDQVPFAAFLEVFKYAMKFSDLANPDLWEAYGTLAGRRLVGSLGAFRGVEIPEDLTDAPLLDDSPFIDLFYRYYTGPGYCALRAAPRAA